MDDLLHGYLQGDGYIPAKMEEDGDYPEVLNWTYQDVPQNTPDTTYLHYNGPGPCLKNYVDNKFKTLLGVVLTEQQEGSLMTS